MKARVRWASVALAMLLAAPGLAAEVRPDSTQVRTGSAPGRGGVGGLVGGSFFYGSDDYSQGALPRFSFDGHYRYTFSPRVRGQVSPGFTWAAYSKKESPPFVDPAFPSDATKEHYLALLVPTSVQLQLTMGKRPWLYYVGAGPGLYRVWVQNHRKVLRDPSSLELHRNLFWGFTAEVGVERFLKALPSTSVEVALASHTVFSEDTQKFPSAWNSSLGAATLRAGVNYYFDLMKPKRTSEVPLPGGAR